MRDVCSVLLAVLSSSSPSFCYVRRFPCHHRNGNLHFSWHCFYMQVKRWSLESQKDVRYDQQSKTMTECLQSTYSDEAPRPWDIFHPGGKMDLRRWAHVPGHVAILQVPPPLLTR